MTDRVWPEVYKKLGVSPIINAQSWVTSLGGSIMRPEVLSAMDEAANAFVDMKRLLVFFGCQYIYACRKMLPQDGFYINQVHLSALLSSFLIF